MKERERERERERDLFFALTKHIVEHTVDEIFQRYGCEQRQCFNFGGSCNLRSLNTRESECESRVDMYRKARRREKRARVITGARGTKHGIFGDFAESAYRPGALDYAIATRPQQMKGGLPETSFRCRNRTLVDLCNAQTSASLSHPEITRDNSRDRSLRSVYSFHE